MTALLPIVTFHYRQGTKQCSSGNLLGTEARLNGSLGFRKILVMRFFHESRYFDCLYRVQNLYSIQLCPRENVKAPHLDNYISEPVRVSPA